jgi:cytoplasmic polyadenylation element-binding protein
MLPSGLDTDKHKYPIGSGRVTFNNHKSYSRVIYWNNLLNLFLWFNLMFFISLKAVTAAFIEIKSDKFTKKVQVDPWLEVGLIFVLEIFKSFKTHLY